MEERRVGFRIQGAAAGALGVVLVSAATPTTVPTAGIPVHVCLQGNRVTFTPETGGFVLRPHEQETISR